MEQIGETLGTLAGEVAVVTGGSLGIGRATAIELASAGAKVAVGYRKNAESALDVVAAIRAAGGEACAIGVDVRDEAQVKNLFRETATQLGGVTILVCSAGITRDKLLGAMSTEDWDDVLNVNLRGLFLCAREALPFMLPRRSGSIIALSSVAASMAGRGHANYAASKGALESLVRSLAVEVASRSIRVNAIAPGIIETDMSKLIRAYGGKALEKEIPLRRFGKAEEVARVVRFLASKEASYVTGVVLPVAGGLGLRGVSL